MTDGKWLKRFRTKMDFEKWFSRNDYRDQEIFMKISTVHTVGDGGALQACMHRSGIRLNTYPDGSDEKVSSYERKNGPEAET